jgi:hypothetical protein
MGHRHPFGGKPVPQMPSLRVYIPDEWARGLELARDDKSSRFHER